MCFVKFVRVMNCIDLCIKGLVFVGIPAGHAFWTSVGGIARVDGVSMQPTFNSNPVKNDWVYFSRLRKYEVLPGDVVILFSPKNPEEKIMKRVVVVNGYKMVNSPEPHWVSIPPGHIWVEGDNKEKSNDSNHFGPVPLGLIVGKVKGIVWPLNRIQAIETKLTWHASS